MESQKQQKKRKAALVQEGSPVRDSPQDDLVSPKKLEDDDAPTYVIGTCYLCGMDCSPNSQACKTCVAKTFRF